MPLQTINSQRSALPSPSDSRWYYDLCWLLPHQRRPHGQHRPDSKADALEQISPDKNTHCPPAPAAFTHQPFRWNGLHHLVLAHPDRHASYAVRIPRCRISPPASSPPHLAVTQLPST